MTKLIYNNDNTEGHHETSYDFRDTELRKDDKIVATDLVDLYDVELTNLTGGEVLVYNDSKQKWINGEAGAECNVIDVDTTFTVGNDQYTDFDTLEECFKWLRYNCIVIKDGAIVYIDIKYDIYIYSYNDISLNHPYGDKIVITNSTNYDGQVYIKALVTYNSTTKEISNYYNPLILSNNNNINIDEMRLVVETLGQSVTTHWYDGAIQPTSRRARFRSTSVYIDGKVYVFGGAYLVGYSTRFLNDLWSYDPITKEWVFLKSYFENAKAQSVSSVLNGNMYIFGGWNDEEDFTNILKYNPITNQMSFVGDNCPNSNMGNNCTTINGKIYFYNRQGLYSYNGIWRDTYPRLPDYDQNDTSAILAGIGDKLYIHFKNKKCEVFDTSLDVWIPSEIDDTNHGDQSSLNALGNSLYLFEANDRGSYGNRNIMWVCDVSDGSWVQGELQDNGTARTSFCTATNDIENTLIILDGCRGREFEYQHCYGVDYNQEYFAEEQITLNGEPSSRVDHIFREYHGGFIEIYDNAYMNVNYIKTSSNEYFSSKTVRYDYEEDMFVVISVYMYTIKLMNNSYIDLADDNELSIYTGNNSTINIDPNTDQNYLVKNGSTVITNDVTKFDNSTFINAKLIDKKEMV